MSESKEHECTLTGKVHEHMSDGKGCESTWWVRDVYM